MPKIALVTGGNRGLGFEVARQLASVGNTVVIGTRERQRGDEAAAKLRADGLDADSVVLDVDDPASVERAAPYYSVIVPAYQASKAALNSVTVGLAKLLADTPIKVNAVCPGFVRTNLTPMNRDQAPLTACEAARVVVRYALIDETGPSGGFFDQAAAVAW